jgi:membrane protease YdiL (CAAX protease family)
MIMAKSIQTAARACREIQVPQVSFRRILFMFLWPAVWYIFVIYGLAGRFVVEGERIGSWMVLLIGVVTSGAELLAGLLLLRREGYRKGDNRWRERIRWRWPKGLNAWILVIVVFVLAFAASQLVPHLADTPGFVPPDWWPAGSDPRAEIDSAADVFPDINLQGNYLFLLAATGVTILFNIFGEEIYYRGYLLPRMRGAFGGWDWVANGVYTTNAIESIQAQLRKVTSNRGAFPSPEAVRKVLYLAIERISRRWKRPIKDWVAALNHFTIVFEGRVPN